jgi:micrococcal nuclease
MNALAFLLCACISLEPAYVVIDGDSFVLAGERIRIANIEAPALHEAGCKAESQSGERAKRRLESLLVAGFITVNRGDAAAGPVKDQDGSTLATVSVDGVDVGEAMIAEGVAWPSGQASAIPAAAASDGTCIQASGRQ